MIGSRMKDARKAAGESAEQIAEFLGVSPVTIYRYESGKIKKIPMEFVEPLAKHLHVSQEWLMGWENDVGANCKTDLKLYRKEQETLDLMRQNKSAIILALENMSTEELATVLDVFQIALKRARQYMAGYED